MTDKGKDTFNRIKDEIAVVLEDGDKFYQGNKTAGARARRALDRLAKLKVQWRKETKA